MTTPVDRAYETESETYARMDDAIHLALSIYAAERIARRDAPADAVFDLPAGSFGPLEIDAAAGFLVDVLESAGEIVAAQAVLYVLAYRRSPRKVRAAVLALATCGMGPLGYEAAARLAAGGPISGGPPPNRPDARPRPLRTGDVVHDPDAPGKLCAVRSVHPDGKAFISPVDDPEDVRSARADELVRVERPTVEPLRPVRRVKVKRGDVVRDRLGSGRPVVVQRVHEDGRAFVAPRECEAGRWAKPADLAPCESEHCLCCGETIHGTQVVYVRERDHAGEWGALAVCPDCWRSHYGPAAKGGAS